MNSNTKAALKRFIDQVEALGKRMPLSYPCSNLIELTKTSEALKEALDKDETIPD